jgi:hypothetical protein
VAQVSGASTLSAKDCTFERANFGVSRFSSASLDNCITYGPNVLTSAQVTRATGKNRGR